MLYVSLLLTLLVLNQELLVVSLIDSSIDSGIKFFDLVPQLEIDLLKFIHLNVFLVSLAFGNGGRWVQVVLITAHYNK